MAKVNNKGMVSGTAGSVVYRNYRGMNIIQGKPRRFKQTEASIRSSSEFGLSSSTAGIIRAAFQPAYLYRDGEAASRSTQLVYRSLRNSCSGSVGQRDLHNGDLSHLCGMEFNTHSKLSEVLQVSHQVSRDEQGRIIVSLAAIQGKTAIRPPSWILKNASRYRIRLSLIGFNFRREYFEYLGFREIDMSRYDQIEAQQIVFDAEPPKDQILLLSMSVMAYSRMSTGKEGLLLNSREFSPCAIIAAFAAEEPDELLYAGPDLRIGELPESRQPHIIHFGYEGNRLLRKMKARMKLPEKQPQSTTKEKLPPGRGATGELTGKRVSFSKR